ncbi:hypothetical protein I302_104834 [Kwoniella bestiolae CBS 10118]|uniref:Uncharacterized protein n=1 Tax=Kwoniella bestiolae CBS 10118 TaxID=1296100 RepID=A0A1B9FRM0_9TREE|nr:hypothetical protein I302_09097 [Kwoniella bestiolae CBS 10118]OCF21419.1 hypothetical protein I302_09097 [Kwoniella bestiolae CBS 10118]
MAPPPVTIYVTSLTSAPKVRKHIDLLRRSLNGLEIPYEEYDLVMDEEAKKKWQRSKPPGVVVGLPGYLVGGEWVGTMEDFEDAVETQTLESFLKQDLDLSHPASLSSDANAGAEGGLPSQKSIQEVELEKLMREMTNEDLDKLMGELGVDESTTKIGLIDKPEEASKEGISDVKESEKVLLGDLKKELDLDEKEDKLLRGVEGDDFGSIQKSRDEDKKDFDTTVSNTRTDTGPEKSDKTEDKGEGIKGMVEENDIVQELKKELLADKHEDKDIDDIVNKEKID